MLGAIVGDVAGSCYEFHPVAGNWEEFPLFTDESKFTDDTVMTLAVAQALCVADNSENLSQALIARMHEYGRTWPHSGYGGKFAGWLRSGSHEAYNSFGNGSAMRVSPAAWAAGSLEEAEKLAQATAAVTHNHPEGIKGAKAVAGSIYLARLGKSRNEIRDYVSSAYNYDLNRTLTSIRETYDFDETCQGSVPEAIIAFLESDNFEQAIRKAIWLRGDADTQAAIAGSIAEAFYGGVQEELAQETLKRLDDRLLVSNCKNYEHYF